MRAAISLAAIAFGFVAPGIASAQRFSFEQAFDIQSGVTIDVTTHRGKIDVVAGPYDRVVVSGAVTVRVAWDSPPDAVEIARRLAKAPPITRAGSTVRLRPPADDVERRAVTIDYQVRVPIDTEVVSESESGATSISGVGRKVTVRTQSAAITLARLGGDADVDTGSGAVRIDDVRGALRVTTSSSGITARGIAAALRVRTQSGQVEATLVGGGDVDVETGSSAIRLRGVNGGLTVTTESGRVDLDGAPSRAWTVNTGSGAVDARLHAASFSLDAMTQSGSVKVTGAAVTGTTEDRRVAGEVGSGGPLVRISCRSGSITLAIGR